LLEWYSEHILYAAPSGPVYKTFHMSGVKVYNL